MNRPIIEFDRVSKSFPLYHAFTGGLKRLLTNLPEAIRSLKSARFHALDDVSFSVKRGEAIGIIGRNGAGKSTILALIAGVIRPTHGRVVVRDRVSPLLELGAGFHPELTGRENIELNGVLLGLSRHAVLKKERSIVEFSEIGDHIDQPTRTYSSGTVARLAFSVIVHLDPRILLIDEILAVGDMSFEKKCIDIMLQFKRQGVTMVYVSHSMPQVEKLCDRLIWIEDHSVKKSGEPKEIIRAYTEHVM